MRRWVVPGAGLLGCMGVLAALCLPMMPNNLGRLGVDWSIWLPDLLAGAYFHAQAPVWALPWFNPAQCAGVPLHADPQGAYLSLPQVLTFVMPPLLAIQLCLFAYGAAGFAGMWVLARRAFLCSRPASLVAAMLFGLNGMFSARMMVGHLSFAPFMLVPAMAVCVLCPGPSRRAAVLGMLGVGVLVAAVVQAGMAVLVLPAMLALALLVLLHALFARGRVVQGCVLIGGGTAIGVALCAGKLAAVLALMAHVPRDAYPLPGFRNVAQAAWMAVRCLFLFPSAAMSDAMVNSVLDLEQHEFDYRIGPAPLLLLGWAGLRAWRSRAGAPYTRRRVLWEGLALCLLLPVMLNVYFAPWTALLKHIPVLRSASSLLRWFAAYIPFFAIASGLALDRAAGARAWSAAAGAIALTCATLLLGGHESYGASGVGVYDPSPIQAAWQRFAATGTVQPIRSLGLPLDAAGKPDMGIGRENLMADGASPLLCYDALFGYRLEAFRRGTLHAGPVLDETQAGTRRELNLKNPACYVFPAANGCAPGDTFLVSQRLEATAFAQYRPFAFAKPPLARLADWVGILAAVLTPLTCMVLLAWPWVTRRRRAA